MKIVEVVAALIWEDHRFLICKRPANKAQAFLWEFVGGKVESGETKEQALIRECREELAVTIAVGDEFANVTHVYPDTIVHLTLFHATIQEGTPMLLEHCALKWISPSETTNYRFCPADEELLAQIRSIYRDEPCSTD